MSKLHLISIKPNANKPGQCTVVFGQERENASPLAKLLSVTQGTNSSSIATCVQSFKTEMAQQYFGTTAVDYKAVKAADRPGVEAFEAAMGGKLKVQIIESLTPNPARPSQEPKKNPTTGVILTKDDQPIYREGVLAFVADTAAVDTLIQHDAVAATAAAPAASALELAAA